MLPNLPEVGEWLLKAQNDLLSARVLLEHTPPIVDTACFHSQQAVEKALKGFLVFRGVRFERVHNLVYLLDLCEARDSSFAEVREPAEALAPYAVDVRYPGAPSGISEEDAHKALAAAEAVWSLVLSLLPASCHPA